jgi:hypothetical protein
MTLRGRDRGANTRQHNDPASGWAAGTTGGLDNGPPAHQVPNELVRAYPPSLPRLAGLLTVMAAAA